MQVTPDPGPVRLGLIMLGQLGVPTLQETNVMLSGPGDTVGTYPSLGYRDLRYLGFVGSFPAVPPSKVNLL